MSDKDGNREPDSIIDNASARSMVVGSVSFEGARSLADGIAWLLSSPDLKGDGDEGYDVEVRMQDTPNAGVAELVLFLGKEGDGKEADSAFAIIVSPKSRQGG